MKNYRIVFSLAFLFAVLFALPAKAQSRQAVYTLTLDNEWAACLDEAVSGTLDYHLTYHINRKTGVIDRVRWNLSNAVFIGSDTGTKYRIMDVGSDALGLYWDFFADVSDLPPELIPEELPSEGTLMNMAFKWVAKGVVYSGNILIHLNYNANGELKGDVLKYNICF